MGEMLDKLDRKGIVLAGQRAPYGFSGTREWLTSIAQALELDVSEKIDAMEARYRPKFLENKEKLKGKKVFVSGGPGRIIGLLHTLMDYEMDIQVACMFWPHDWSKKDIQHMMEQHNLHVKEFILSPGVPITVYTTPHVGFEGTVNLGNKLLLAMSGFSFTESCFTAREVEGYVCPPNG